MKIAAQGRLAVVTGAAGGLGLAFANKLAERGYSLLLVDRRQGELEQVCESIAAQHGVSVETYAVDLCQRGEVERLAQRLVELPVELLVNNAGFGGVDYFVDTDVNFLLGMVDVHVVAPTILTRAVLPGMIERSRGNIINVSSMGAWFHSAGNAQYGATKSYLAVFSESLQQELRGTNVGVQALCPGFVRTAFHASKEMQGFHQRPPAARMWMLPEEVAECSLRSLNSNRVVVIPGIGYRIMGRFAQMPLLRPLMQWITRVPRTVAANSRPAEAGPEQIFSMPKKA